jgi:hypothetical protein
LFHMAFIGCQYWGCTVRVSSISFWPFLMALTDWRTTHMKERVSLNFPSTTCNTLAYFYPTKHEILLTFSHSSVRSFLVIFPDP